MFSNKQIEIFILVLTSTEKICTFGDDTVCVNDCFRHLKFPGKHASYSNTAQTNENLYPVNLGKDRDHKAELIQKGKRTASSGRVMQVTFVCI